MKSVMHDPPLKAKLKDFSQVRVVESTLLMARVETKEQPGPFWLMRSRLTFKENTNGE